MPCARIPINCVAAKSRRSRRCERKTEIKVAIAASENSIYPTLQSSVLYDSTARTYFKRTPDTRSSSDIIYKVRYVIPKDSLNLGAAPIEGYILQESSSTTVRTDSDFTLSSGLNKIGIK